MASIYPVIMSGGSGTRLWPLSRITQPKQYHSLISDSSLLEETIARIGGASGENAVAPPTIICGAGHEHQVRGLLTDAGITPHAILLEPMGRNTAPVAVMAALCIAEADPNGLVLLLPADHHVSDPAAFRQAIADAVPHADAGYLTTFGIQPTRPETGFGYIRRGQALGDSAFMVDAFVEKPDRETAANYVDEGIYAWNAGIFMFRADTLLKEAAHHAPAIHAASVTAYNGATRDGNVIRLEADLFAQVPSDSIDYAIMEHTEKAAMIGPVDMGWNDVGSWQAVYDLLAKSGDGVIKGDAITHDCKNVMALSNGPLVATIGVEDLVVIATEDAVLVVKTERSQDVKHIVERLKKDGRTDLL